LPLHEWEEDLASVSVTSEGGILEGVPSEPVTWIFDEGSFSPAAKLVGDAAFSILSDYLGKPEQMYDSSGELTWDAEYDIYGNIRKLRRGSLKDCPFRFPGQYADDETGLYYNRFRYYDPGSGGYVSQDPIGLAGGHRLFSYTRDINRFIDPFGQNDLQVLTQEAHSQLGESTQGYKTTAIGRDANGNLFIASNDELVPKPQREWAKSKGITPVRGVGHAEETLINNVENIRQIEASRGVCLDCEDMMTANNVESETPKTSKKSKTRKIKPSCSS
jgi:RHS repeat-associated protein